MQPPSIIQIDDVLVSGEILTEYFCCDIDACQGACCIVGDSGAPLEECELEALEKNYPVFSPLMRPEGRAAVAAKGFFEVDRDGDLVTPLVDGSEECAYCRFLPQDLCLCSIESRWLDGQGDFRKPISCQLYPIRVSHLDSGLTALNLHRWEICKAAFEKGRRENVRVWQFLQEPLIRYLGEDFYETLSAASKAFL